MIPDRASNLFRRMTAELLGVFAIVFFGCGAIMVAERFPGSVSPVAVPVIFGLVVASMIYAAGHISGAHFNPAVTLAFAISRHFPARDVIAYWIAQCAGAFLATAMLASILPHGATYGATIPHITQDAACVWEGLLTFFLMFVIMGVATDTRAVGIMAGAAIGAMVMLDAFIGGAITGASMNPARSLAPAIYEGRMDVLWIYIAGPMIGASIASLLYQWVRGKTK